MDPARLSYHPSISGPAATPWPASATVAQQAGFAVTDLALQELDGVAAADVREILAVHRLVTGGAPLPVEFRRDEATYLAGLGHLECRARLAAEVGVEVMYRSIPAAAAVPRHELEPVLRRRLAACASILRNYGIALALEVLGPLHRRREAPHEFVWRLPDCAAFAASVGPDVGVLVDSWHWHHGGGTTDEIDDVAALILHAHLADAPDLPPEAIRDDERVLPGDGVADLGTFLIALESTGYVGAISLEIPGRWYASSDPAACARAARQAAERALAER